MSRARARITTIIETVGGAQKALSQEVVPMREEIYSGGNLKSFADVGEALQKVQRHIAESTAPARSLVSQGGTEWPDVAFVSGVPRTFAHGCEAGLSVKTIASVPRNVPNSGAFLYEVSQNPANGTITLECTASATFDLAFCTRPGVAR